MLETAQPPDPKIQKSSEIGDATAGASGELCARITDMLEIGSLKKFTYDQVRLLFFQWCCFGE